MENKDARPVIERIKTFEDACKELGDNYPLVVQYREIYNCFLDGADERNNSDLVAYMKLRIICAALNEGWEPQFTEDEWRYYPWFCFCTQEEIDSMNEEKRQDHRMISIGDFQTDYVGFACTHSTNIPSTATMRLSYRLCLKSDTLAIYCGNQFLDIWADFVLIKK